MNDIILLSILQRLQELAAAPNLFPSANFMAYGIQSLSNGDVTFPSVILNGNGYNSTTGVFTSPISGVFYFNVSLCLKKQTPATEIHSFTKKDGVKIQELFAKKGQDSQASICTVQSSTVHLNANDNVKVTELSSAEVAQINDDLSTTFLGFLIRKD